MSLKTILVALPVLLFAASPLRAESISGQVVNIIDGHTIEVLHTGKMTTIRLDQIYAPLQDQPFGRTARNFLFRVATNKQVTVEFDNYDLYGRAAGEVILPDGTNLNKLLVRVGLAWRYDGYSSDPEYGVLEADARKMRLGLWAVDNSVPPWEWRWVQARAAGARAGGEEGGFRCGSKKSCYEMSSCEEAKFFLYGCGLSRLDRDGNGVPCENLCEKGM